MLKDKIRPDEFDDWKCVYETSIESEANLVHEYLQDQGVSCQILSKKDSSFNVNFGDLSLIFVYVPENEVRKAEKALKEWKDGKIDYEGKGDPETDSD